MESVLQSAHTKPDCEPLQRSNPACFHCGTPCPSKSWQSDGKSFCCQGCLIVFELLTKNGLNNFYDLSENAGVRVRIDRNENAFAYLDAPGVRERIVQFTNDRTTKVLFRIPAIHCIACVWLLENLFRLKEGIGQSQANFPRKEVAITFATERVKLSEVVSLLASLGYEPDLKFSDLDQTKSPVSRRLWLQLGFAGFAFGNTMLFSISSYVGLDIDQFKELFGWLSFVLSLPVVFYSAADYWKSSWASLRRKLLTIEVPIAAGIIAIFAQSTWEVFSGRGEGYFDSLAGLLFFLLCGKLFQQKTFARLSFERDYKSFFPLSVTRLQQGNDVQSGESISLSQLAVGDRLLIRHGELIPADARLISNAALIDYSFVTGESEAVQKKDGDGIYAGGRQIGAAIEVEITKAVSQSYLTLLWNQDAFKKDKAETLDTLTNVYSYRFTKLILAIAVGAALFWWFVDPSLAIKAFTSVLIVACPCALALAAPFALGTAQRFLARRNIFLKNPAVIETLAKVNAVVFDKTGTLTAAGAGSISFHGESLGENEKRSLAALARNSTHPLSVRIAEAFGESNATVRSFSEKTGCGVEGVVDGKEIALGSRVWIQSKACGSRPDEASSVSDERRQNEFTVAAATNEASVHFSIDGRYRGYFSFTSALRPQIQTMANSLSENCELALLSGDNERERETFSRILGAKAQLRFNQSPQDKFAFVDELHRQRKTVMMVGDGLNDAGALKNADVGVAVVENTGAFSPASDVIMDARMVPQLSRTSSFSNAVVRVVRLSFLISTIYNIAGISIAASGKLAPVVCAILMPLSSVTVVAFACGMTTWLGKLIFDEAAVFSDSKSQKSKMHPSLLESAVASTKEAA